MKRQHYTIVLILMLLLSCKSIAQSYKMELGVLSGVSSYMGEANFSSPLLNTHTAIGLLGRYNLSGNIALKGNLLTGKISGSNYGDAKAYMLGTEVKFDRGFVDAGLQLEIGFYQYGVPAYRIGSAKVSPYVSAGLGLTGYQAQKSKVCMNIPFGIGIKAKALPNVNVGAEWCFRKTFADDLDYAGNVAAFRLNNDWDQTSSWNKNKDWYSVLMLYVTIDLFKTGSKCYR